MSYSWILPGSSSTPTPTPIPTSGTSSATEVLGGLYDQELDGGYDFLDTDNGEWSETQDSRSIVLCMLEMELGKSYTFPGDGTSIKEFLRTGEPLTPAIVIADVRRAMRVLEGAGILSLLDVQGVDENGEQLRDETGRPAFVLSWIDLATGSPVDAVYRPEGA